jgi:probable phosphoglycerate mutase
MKLYFVRHGESQANLSHEFSNRGLKHGLTARGREQALALVERLGDIPVRKLFSSPLLRAVQTARVLSYALAVPYETTDALREYDCGVLEGKSDPASWQLYTEVYQDWVRGNHWERRIEGGESFLDIQSRFLPFIEDLMDAYGQLSVNIILVGHGGLYRCMLPRLLENIDFEFAAAHPLEYTDCVVAQVHMSRVLCVEWGGIPLPLSRQHG